MLNNCFRLKCVTHYPNLLGGCRKVPYRYVVYVRDTHDSVISDIVEKHMHCMAI